MNPMLNPNDFEGFGSGFGSSTPEQVDELNKALTAGYGYQGAPGSLAGGGVLQVESLDATLKIVSFMMKNIVLYNDLPKSQAYNTVEEYNRLVNYGGTGGIFIDEGALPRSEDSLYAREVSLVKFFGSTREITHPMLLVRPAHGNVVALETKNGAMFILQKLEQALFSGDSACVAQEIDGLFAIIKAGLADSSTAGDGLSATTSDNIIDLRGACLTEGAIEQGSEVILNNYGYPTDLYLATKALSNLSKTMYPKERYMIPAPTDGQIGFAVKSISTNGGLVALKPDVFLRAIKGPPAQAANSMAPTAPASVTVTVQAVSTSRGFDTTSELGSYYYGVTAISKNGESVATLGNAAAAVAGTLSAEVKLSIVPGAVSGNDAVQAYRVYRSKQAGLSTDIEFIRQIPVAGNPTVVLDGNEDLPGCSKAYMLQRDETNLTFRQLSPMLKFPLATTASSIRWMQLMYACLIMFTPRRNVIFKNVGDVIPAAQISVS